LATTLHNSSSYLAASWPLFGWGKSFIFNHVKVVLKLTFSSVQTVTGGQCMSVLLTAIWPSFARIPNHIPEDQGITTSGMVGFLLYFLLQLPFLCIPYTKVSLIIFYVITLVTD
jgi:NCS1 family nucleobase:cation symporter-1